MVRRAVKQDSRCAAFHAGWVARDGRALLFAGEGASGKSGLCLEGDDARLSLRRRGRDVLCRRPAGAVCPRHPASARRSAARRHRARPVVRRLRWADVRRGSARRRRRRRRRPRTRPWWCSIPTADGPPQPLSPLEGLQRLLGLCHRLDRTSQALFDTITSLAAAGRVLVASPDRGARPARSRRRFDRDRPHARSVDPPQRHRGVVRVGARLPARPLRPLPRHAGNPPARPRPRL